MIKNCQSCNAKFDGRRDAKTCSVRCRKRFQRAKTAILHEAGVLKQDIEQVVDKLKDAVLPVNLTPATVLAGIDPSADGSETERFPEPSWEPRYLDLPEVSEFSTPTASAPASPQVPPTVPPPLTAAPSTSFAAPSPTLAQSVEPELDHKLLSELEVPTNEQLARVVQPSVAPGSIISAVSPPVTPVSTISAVSPQVTTPEPTLLSLERPEPQPPITPSFEPPAPQSRNKLSFLKTTPLKAAMGFTVLIMVLVGGIAGVAKIFNHTQAPAGSLSSSSSQQFISTDSSGVINLNLDTAVAKGKTLTVGQIISGPGASVLQITGDVQSSGTLLASGGGSSLSNGGLKINNVIVCTAAGCTSSAQAGNTTSILNGLLTTATLQGNSFNGPSQLVQLTGSGLLPILSGVNLTNLDASKIASGSLDDARLSSNVALLNGSPLFKNTTNSTTAFRIQNATGTNLLVVDTTTGTVTIVGLQGSGANLTSLNASNVSSGTLADSRLSANVALLNGTGPQIFTGNNKFTGTLLAQNSSNSTSAFAIQNAAGSSNLLIADTTNSRIAIGQATAAYTLDVNGDINSATGIRVGGALLCSASGCTANSGSSNYIQNSLNLQTANFNIQTVGNTSVTGIIRASTGQSADLLQLKDSSSTNIVTFGPTGNVLIQPSTNSTTAFQVFNANATSHLIGGDTLNARVAIAKPTPPDYTLDVGGDINTTTGLRVAGNLVCSTTCTPGGGSGNYIQNGTALQTANYAIQSDLNTHIVALIRGASGQSADLLDLVNGDSGANIASFGSTGSILLKNSTDSATAFRIQNLSGNNYLLVNTSGATLSLGDTGIASTVQIGNTTGAVAQTVNIGNNATASSTSTVVIGNLLGASTTTIQAGTGNLNLSTNSATASIIAKSSTNSTTAFQVQNAAGNNYIAVDTSGANLNLGNGGIANTIQIGNTTGAVAQTVNIGNNATASSSTALNLGNVLAATTFSAEAGTGTTALFNGATNHTIQLGTGAAVEAVTIGSTNSTSTLNLQGGTGATAIQLATGASGGTAGTIGIGNTTGANTQTINIGTNGTASSTTNITIGSTIAGTTTVQSASGLVLGKASSVNGTLQFSNSGGTNTASLQLAANPGSSYTLLLPTTGPAVSQCLQTDSVTASQLKFGSCASGITLQSAYTASTGGTTSEIILDTTRSAVDIQDRSTSNGGTIGANLFNVRATAANDSTAGTLLFGIGNTGSATFQNSSNSTTAFQIQNASAANLFTVNTSTTNNLITNGDFEGATTTGWAAKGSTTISQVSTHAWQGNNSLSVATTTAANDGASYNFTLSASTQYTLSLYAKVASGSITDFVVGHQDVSGTDINCLTAQTVTTSWTRFSCTFTTGATITSSNIYIQKSGASAETIYIDGVQLQTGASATAFDPGGKLQLSGIVNSPLTFQNKSDSTTAFQVQNAAGTSNLFVADSLNSRLGIGTSSPGNLLSVNTLTVADSTATVAISTGNLNNKGLVIQGVASQSANSFQTQDSTGAVVFSISASGSIRTTSVAGLTTNQAYISPGVATINSGAVTIRTNADANIGLAVQGNSASQSGDLFRVQTSTPTTLFSVNATGAVLSQNSSNSTTAFQVQNAAGNNYIAVDTSGANLNLGNGGIASTVQIGNTTGAVAQTINIGNNATASSTSTVVIGSSVGNSATSIRTGAGNLNLNTNTGNLNLSTSSATASIIATSNVNSTTAFQVQNSAGTSVLTVDTTNQRVGIGTISPSNTLQVIGSICAKSTNAACAANVAGTIYATNTTVQAADLAENYISSQSLEPGTVVIPEGDGNNLAIDRSLSAYQTTTLGIISTNPGVTLNSDAKTDSVHPYLLPVALAGRVPVNVTDENGPIMPGDYLTTSSTPGYAMKATQAGPTIGKALEGFSGTGTGKILAFINISYYGGPGSTISDWQGGSATLDSLVVHANATTTTLTVTGVTALKGTVTIAGDTTVQGTLTLGDHFITTGPAVIVTAEAGAGTDSQGNPNANLTSDGNDQAGTITVTSGSNPTAGILAKVTFHKPYGKAPKVILTPSNDKATDLKYFYNSATGGFTLQTANSPAAATTYIYSYFIVQ